MKNILSEKHVLPRPVELLPDYAHAKARQTCADKIVEACGLTREAATTISNSVVDPTEVRKLIGDPADPRFEERPVPGGTILGIRTKVWARRVMPDPRNPRLLPSRRHPFAVEPGTDSEDSKFRPVPEPRAKAGVGSEVAELSVDIESRHHLTWALQQAATYVFAKNDWRDSIALQGIMEDVWLVATTYQHADGSDPVTVLASAEGSSRVTASHSLLSIRSADVPYEQNDSKLRAHYRKLNEALERGLTPDDQVALRCEQIPALIFVGFRKHPQGITEFPTAVKSLVALRHVDHPEPWGEGPENESLADEVLDELYRRSLISSTERDYFAGSCTKAEARAAHLSDDPVIRAASIVHLFTSDDERIRDAIRTAVTSQSTRKRMTPKLWNALATALILRATDNDDPAKTDQIRRYMRHAFGKSVHSEVWDSTNRDTERLVKEALKEVQFSTVDETDSDPGPASLELAVRAAYPLVVTGKLNADRGSRGNSQPDRRTPGEVLDAMRRNTEGVLQLRQALYDFAEDRPIRAVDEKGLVKKLPDDSEEQLVNDVYLRSEFPPAGKARAPRPGDSPMDYYHNCLNAISENIEQLQASFIAISEVAGDDGRALVDIQGVQPRLCSEWREILRKIDDELVGWRNTFKRKFGAGLESSYELAGATEIDDSVSQGDEYSESYDHWDDSQELDESELQSSLG